MNICPYCKKEDRCLPLAKNALGVEIQEYSQDGGWTSDSPLYPAFCIANAELKKLPVFLGIQRRTYTRLTKQKRK